MCQYASLDELEREIVGCRICPRLVAWREKVGAVKRKAYQDQTYWAKPVQGFGDENAKVLVVGLAPGAHGSNRTGRMFTGDDSGNFLYHALYRAGFANQPTAVSKEDGLALDGLFITAVCRCVPPDNKPSPGEIAACLPYLNCEIQLLPTLKGIVALGRIAYDTIIRMLYPTDQGREIPAFGHGVLLETGKGTPWILASYHPSRQNTQTGKLTVPMFDAIWAQVSRMI
jgi:uracil-DNA glycosylase family 4